MTGLSDGGGKAAARQCGLRYFRTSWMFCQLWGQGRQRPSDKTKRISLATLIQEPRVDETWQYC